MHTSREFRQSNNNIGIIHCNQITRKKCHDQASVAQAVFVSDACVSGSLFPLTLLFASILLCVQGARTCQVDESCQRDICLAVVVAVVTGIL